MLIRQRRAANVVITDAQGRVAAVKGKRHSFLPGGTLFTGRLLAQTQVGSYRAVIPTISGHVWITGLANYVVDAEDPFPSGFTVGDLWGLNED